MHDYVLIRIYSSKIIFNNTRVNILCSKVAFMINHAAVNITYQ